MFCFYFYQIWLGWVGGPLPPTEPPDPTALNTVQWSPSFLFLFLFLNTSIEKSMDSRGGIFFSFLFSFVIVVVHKTVHLKGIWKVFEGYLNTTPRPPDISMKNWRAKVKPVLTSHLWYKAMLKIWEKSWEPFRIYQLTSTANPAIIC